MSNMQINDNNFESRINIRDLDDEENLEDLDII